MTLLTAAALPAPLPPGAVAPARPGTPGSWGTNKLVRAEWLATTEQAAGPPQNQIVDDHYHAIELTRPDGPPAAFVRAGSDFSEAIRAANQAAKSVTSRDGLPVDAAQAVLLGADGYYVATLGKRSGSYGDTVGLLMNGAQGSGGSTIQLRDLTALNPDVKAVVDRDEWINFSGEAVDVKLTS